MAVGNLVFDVKIAWWFKYLYLPIMQLFCATFSTEPDMGKVNHVLGKAMTISKPKWVRNV